jgi:hypothetical protein
MRRLPELKELRREYVSPVELSNAVGRSSEWIRTLAKRENWRIARIEGRGRGGKTLAIRIDSLPAEYRDKLALARSAELLETKKDDAMLDQPAWQREIAFARLAVLQYFNRYLDASYNGKNVSKLHEIWTRNYAAGMLDDMIPQETREIVGKFSPRTLQRWNAAYKASGIRGLLTAYGKRKGQTIIPAEDRETILRLWRDQSRLRIQTIYNRICELKAQELAKLRQLTLRQAGDERSAVDIAECKREVMSSYASYDTILRYVRSQSCFASDVYHREGGKMFKDSCTGYVERDPLTLEINQIWNSDGHRLNCWVRHPYEPNRKVRPNIVVFMDLRSKMITGWSINLHENTGAVISALAKGIGNYGVPDTIYLDNGKAYKNKQTMGISRNKMNKTRFFRDDDGFALNEIADHGQVTGAFGRFGVNVIWALPYNAKAKPVEPFWNVLNNYGTRFVPTYGGNSIAEKPERLPSVLADPSKLWSLDELTEYFEAVIEEYNRTPSNGAGMNGKMPVEVWRDGISRRELRKIPSETLALYKLHRGLTRVVQQNGVKWDERWYDNPILIKWQKKTVEIGLDRDDLTKMYVFVPESKKKHPDGKTTRSGGELICIADYIPPVAYYKPGEPQDMEQLAQRKRLERDKLKIIRAEESITARIAGFDTMIAVNALEEKTPEIKEKEDDLKDSPF